MLSRRTPASVRMAGMALARARRMGSADPRVAALRFAWNNRAKMMGAARKIGRAWRGYRKRKRENPRKGVGEAATFGLCKTERMTNAVGTVNTRTIYFTNLLEIDQGTQDNYRLRDRANVRGFKITFVIRNELTTTERLCLNYALISPKQAASVTITNFFRDAGTLRDVDFSTLQAGMTFNFAGLNPDKFKVLTHRKVFLNSTNWLAGNVNTMGRERVINRYFSLKRHIPYSDQSSVPEASLFWVFWLDTTMAAAGQTVQTGVATMNQQITCFFKDPRQ